MSVECVEFYSQNIPGWTYGPDRLEHSISGEVRCSTACELANDARDIISGVKPNDLRYDVNNNGVVDPDDVALLASGTPLSTNIPAPYAVGDRVLINSNYGDYRRLTSYTGTIKTVLANGNYVITFDTPTTTNWFDDQMSPISFTKIVGLPISYAAADGSTPIGTRCCIVGQWLGSITGNYPSPSHDGTYGYYVLGDNGTNYMSAFYQVKIGVC